VCLLLTFHDPLCRPFSIANLFVETTDAQVRDLFAEYGTVELVSIPKNRESGQSRGFAFVDMSSPEEVQKAVDALHGTMYEGRTIRVQKSLPQEEAKKQARKTGEFGTWKIRPMLFLGFQALQIILTKYGTMLLRNRRREAKDLCW
jgi:RNA recognition motif-containing protein